MEKKVLLIDDDEDILAFLTTTLNRSGYQTMALQSPKKGLEILTENEYQVLMLDIMMPNTNGLELLSQIKVINPDFQVIMMTAHANVDSAITALKEGACSYIKKPFESSEVITQVEKAFEKVKLISENKNLINELKIAKEYNEQIIQQLIYTVVVLDNEGNIKKINHAMERLLGYTEEEVVGKPISILFTDEFRDKQWQELANQKRVLDYQVCFKAKNGKEVKASFTGIVMRDEKNNVVGFIGTAKS